MCAVDLLTGLPSSLPPPLCYIPLSVREEEVLLLTLSKGASLASAIVLSPLPLYAVHVAFVVHMRTTLQTAWPIWERAPLIWCGCCVNCDICSVTTCRGPASSLKEEGSLVCVPVYLLFRE